MKLFCVCVDHPKRCKTCAGGQGLQWWPCLTKRFTGGEAKTDHLRVPADLPRCTSCSWSSNSVAVFGSSFPFSSCCFYSWNRNRMLMTWHQEIPGVLKWSISVCAFHSVEIIDLLGRACQHVLRYTKCTSGWWNYRWAQDLKITPFSQALVPPSGQFYIVAVSVLLWDIGNMFLFFWDGLMVLAFSNVEYRQKHSLRKTFMAPNHSLPTNCHFFIFPFFTHFNKCEWIIILLNHLPLAEGCHKFVQSLSYLKWGARVFTTIWPIVRPYNNVFCCIPAQWHQRRLS